MAKNTTDLPIKLSEDDKKMLTDLESDIAKAEKAVAALKELGIDTSATEEKIAFSKKSREILLKEFT